jgi:hypothetical protein
MLKETDKELYTQIKMRLEIQSKSIKFHSFYNYLNDGLKNVIIDCRLNNNNEKEKLIGIEKLNNFSSNNFNDRKFNYKFRLILIIENDCDIKNDKNFEGLREFIKTNNNIILIFNINRENFSLFKNKFPIFFLREESQEMDIERIVAQSTFPLLILDNILYLGNYLNSRNKSQLNCLGVKSIISLLKEEDIILKENFENYFFIETDEVNHGNLEFYDVIEIVENQIKENNTPILIYCFSGQTLSVAASIAILMKIKKWNLMLASAYMMKIIPDFKIPNWLDYQLKKFN